METLYFEDFVDLASDIADTLDNFNSISIVAKYEETKKIIKEILFYKDYELEDIELSSPEFNGYEDEFAISIINMNGIYEVWCEPMKRDTGYFNVEGDITYILSNCSSNVLKYCDLKKSYGVIVDDIEVNTDLGIEFEECDNDLDFKSRRYCKKCKLDKNNINISNHENCIKIKDSTIATDGWTINNNSIIKNKKKDNKSSSLNELSIDNKIIYRVNGEEVDKDTFDKKKKEIDESTNSAFKKIDELDDYFINWNKIFGGYLF